MQLKLCLFLCKKSDNSPEIISVVTGPETDRMGGAGLGPLPPVRRGSVRRSRPADGGVLEDSQTSLGGGGQVDLCLPCGLRALNGTRDPSRLQTPQTSGNVAPVC